MKNVLTQTETIKLADALRAHCTSVEGEAVYESGWDDEKILSVMGAGFTLHNVAGLRKDLCGNLPRVLKAPDARITALEAKLAATETALRALATATADEAAKIKALISWAGNRKAVPFRLS